MPKTFDRPPGTSILGSTMKADRLDALRAKYLDEINQNEVKNRQLRAKLVLLDELDADAQRLSDAPATNGAKYSGVKLTKAILDAIQSIGGNGGVAATEIRKYIAANGYKHPNPKNFPVATVVALVRLAKTEKINTTKTDGKRLFMAKK
jgi:hypothetical protein